MDTPAELIELSSGPAIAIRQHVRLHDLPAFFGGAFGELGAQAGASISGPPFAMYHAFERDDIDVSAVFPLRAPIAPKGRAIALELPGGPAIQVRHVGSYQDLHQTYRTIEQWLEAHQRTRGDAVREVYVTGPGEPDGQPITLVIQPLAPS